jgi:uncharacterized protein
MTGNARVVGITIAAVFLSTTNGRASQTIDAAIAKEISTTWAIDNHAHPVLAPPNDSADKDFDALPADAMEQESDPVALRPDFYLLGAAWKALYGFDTAPPLDANGLKRLNEARRHAKPVHGEHYPEWVLRQARILTMLANRVTMGPGIEPPRFQWVPYADALIFPLDNSGMAAASPDRKQLFALEDMVRARYLKQVGLSAIPVTLDEYLQQVVTATLQRQKAGGAIAEKFELAYLRSFAFSDPSRAEAERIYLRWAAHSNPDAQDYELLQSFLFRYIAMECGQLGLPVHLHAMAGLGRYFSIAGANPLLLEPLFNDPRLRNTNFVLLHGGWPYVREIGALLQKPNVYLDLSNLSLTMTPHTQSQWLREWLEWEPEKVLFGTDAYPFSDELGWPESAWIASRNERDALGMALTGMLDDGEISRKRASELIRMVLRGNAETLYKLRAPTDPRECEHPPCSKLPSN